MDFKGLGLYNLGMKIHSIKITIQDVLTTENTPVVAGFTDIFLDHGQVMIDEEGQPLLTEDGLSQPKFEKISATWLLSQNKVLKAEIQKMAIETITLHDLEQQKKTGKPLDFSVEFGLGIKKAKGLNVKVKKK